MMSMYTAISNNNGLLWVYKPKYYLLCANVFLWVVITKYNLIYYTFVFITTFLEGTTTINLTMAQLTEYQSDRYTVQINIILI